MGDIDHDDPRRRTHADAAAYLLIGPALGAELASFGLWTIALVVITPIAYALAYGLGIASGLLAFATDAATRSQRTLNAVLPPMAAALGMLLSLAWIDWPDRPGLNGHDWLTTWWIASAAITAAVCRRISSRLARPLRVLGWAILAIVVTTAAWSTYLLVAMPN